MARQAVVDEENDIFFDPRKSKLRQLTEKFWRETVVTSRPLNFKRTRDIVPDAADNYRIALVNNKFIMVDDKWLDYKDWIPGWVNWWAHNHMLPWVLAMIVTFATMVAMLLLGYDVQAEYEPLYNYLRVLNWAGILGIWIVLISKIYIWIRYRWMI